MSVSLKGRDAERAKGRWQGGICLSYCTRIKVYGSEIRLVGCVMHDNFRRVVFLVEGGGKVSC